ncbi:archaetidylserine decarboxylase [Undibacterium cyanobacteriorum]|uniref:Phosphatidylserine decarboxylase proenzyme n=1 Tax=Undibacterium cyanobacteriorum TaxID=3073561 RepID=A0ABY9RG79_9BURK|nr:archaetidylserine decarboxylase [Undibacterium sp. 20NA77.5]WMW79951.1 archaetidylserine decarboxylase [Undibacterium sp. 20NA77.5]
MSDRLAVLPQYFLPKHLLTVFAGLIANRRGGTRTTRLINWFVKKYQVDMSEAANPDTASYATFNEFFTRPLREGARPISNVAYVCPVDGAISEFGEIKEGQIFQAKGHEFSATALVGGDHHLAAKYADGQFANIYLSPKDYHRIHMPCDGALKRMIYVPGELFSVNPTTARGVPGLFARNERVVCVFDSPSGEFVLVLVGATIVGSMQTAWHGIVNPPRTKEVREWDYSKENIQLKKGEEMGRFLLGSTVVMLFQKQSMRFNPQWMPAGKVKLGEVMGESA